MAEQTRSKTTTSDFESFDIGQRELESTLEDFLHEEEKEHSNIWNFATITGMAILFVGLSALIQMIGLNIGPDLTGIVEVLPLIGGILVTLIGFGFFVGERGKAKGVSRSKLKERVQNAANDFQQEMNRGSGYDSSSSSQPRTARAQNARTARTVDHGTFTSDYEQTYKKYAKKGAEQRSDSRSSSQQNSGYGQSMNIEDYALNKRKKLFKSRTDKKISGVCAGLAEYFGISTTMVRIIFALGAFFGYGSFILVYIVMAIAMPKEPKGLAEPQND